MTSIVVTGFGATTPIGGDAATTWAAMLAGRSGAAVLDATWAADLPVRIAAPAAVDPNDVLDRVEARRMDRCGQFAMIAAREAWAHTGSPDVDKTRLGVVVASGIGGLITTLSAYDTLRDKGPRRVSPLAIPMLMPNSAAGYVGIEIGARAGVHTPVSACASGTEAIAYGADMIRTGRADIVLAGGTEAAIHALPLAAFAAMKALSSRNDDPSAASRPWDVDRDGFLLGEGAAILVLESAEHAAGRGAIAYAEILGAGMSSDAHHIAQPDPVGTGAATAMRLAVENAGLGLGDIAHVNAHATSTPLGDIGEAQAIRTVFGSTADDMCLTGSKSMIGHLLGAAGAVEALAVVLTLHERLVPPTINVDNLDPAIDLDIVTDGPRKLPGGDLAALNNSFGFG
ncbi:MAG: beta-ketoacyl-ACP synthase II, partial [Actinomycetes bacterium]